MNRHVEVLTVSAPMAEGIGIWAGDRPLELVLVRS